MTETAMGRAFVVMPFGRKPGPDGTMIDFDRIYEKYLEPSIRAAGLLPFRADAERRGGSIHADMFQELLMAELVVADLTVDNPNVWYEIGVRHALRASGVVLTYTLRDRLPFDLNGQRMMRYALRDGEPDPNTGKQDRALLQAAIAATLDAWRGRKASPVYATLPNLREPDWKTLKVGDVNEVWDALERWTDRVQVARQKQRPGDILVLADETPNRALQFEALRTAARALLDLLRPNFALQVLARARALDPDDLACRQLEGIALGRAGKFEEARMALQKLAQTNRDGETLGNLARTLKDEWTRFWRSQRSFPTDPIAAARTSAGALAQAADAYVQAFQANPADYFPGINALLLGRMWEHVMGRPSELRLDRIAEGVRWAAGCALASKRGVWPLMTVAELALLEGDEQAVGDRYDEAMVAAVSDRHRFGVDSARQTLLMMQSLAFRPALVEQALAWMDRGSRQLDGLMGAAEGTPAEPARVVLFSGHMIDKPDRAAPRFPDALANAAASRVQQELRRLGATAGDLGVSQAASGGDLIFASACLDLGMRLDIYLPEREPEFIDASVAFAGMDWIDAFDKLKTCPGVTIRIMPDELGPAPDGVGIYDRCNRWMLNSALSNGLAKVSFITLWDGKDGDGPGGTAEMVELVRRLTGRRSINIDPATLDAPPGAADRARPT